MEASAQTVVDLGKIKEQALDAYICEFFQDCGSFGHFYFSNAKKETRHFWRQAEQAEVMVDALQALPHREDLPELVVKLVRGMLRCPACLVFCFTCRPRKKKEHPQAQEGLGSSSRE